MRSKKENNRIPSMLVFCGFLFSWYELSDKLYPSREVCLWFPNQKVKCLYCTIPIEKDTVYDTEVFLYYFVKCNFPFCFQTQDLWCISVLVIMYDLLHDFSFAKHVLNSYRFYSQTVFIYLIYMVFSWTPCLLSEMMALKHSPFFSLMRVSR